MAHVSIPSPTVRAFPGFNATADSAALRTGMKGLGCKKEEITKILTKRSNEQRQHIAKEFRAKFDKDLDDALKSELSGAYEKLILALLMSPNKFLAHQLHEAMAGIGTDEKALIQILCTRDSAEILKIADAYQIKYNKSLHDKIKEETAGHYQHLLCLLTSGSRKSGSEVDQGKANLQAKKLWEAGELRKGTDEGGFTSLLAVENFAQLRAVFEEYRIVAGKTIEDSIGSELSGDFRDAALTIVQAAKNLTLYYAKQLNDAMSGLGSNDASLIRLVVSRSEVDLGAIKAEFEKLYAKSLSSAVKKNTSGDFEDALIALIGN